MPLISCFDQSSCTLEEYYAKRPKMLELIQFLKETFRDINLYGLTSHGRLVILFENTYTSKWICTLNYHPYFDRYFIEDLHEEFENKDEFKEAVKRIILTEYKTFKT